MSTERRIRNANIECLRIISMVMVVFLHALAKSDLLPNLTSENLGRINTWIAWGLEILCVGAVNIFMLISGYFLVESEFKLIRLIELVAQVLFYSVGGFAVCYAIGIVDRSDISVYNILNYIFPIHMEMFWFITAYVVVYILQPILAKGVKAISKKQFQTVIIICLIYECFMKSILPVRLSTDTKGYSFFWYIIVFLIGAYFRLYGFGFLRKPVIGLLIYFVSTGINLGVTIAVQNIAINMNHLNELFNYSLEYNHILVLAAAVGIFSAFAVMKEKNNWLGKTICFLSPMSLGVYLLHENISVRYEWQHWLGLMDILDKTPILFIGRILLAVLIVYLTGTIVDFIRIQLFKAVKYVWRRVVRKDNL